MKKIVIIVMCAMSSFAACGINLSCQKVRTINGKPANGGEKIFAEQWSRHFYEIKITGATAKDAESKWKIRVLPVLKGCRGGIAFPYLKGIVEEKDIQLDPRKGFSCVYISPLVKWTKDTWRDVGGDWSKGIVNSSVVIELVKEGDDKPTKIWTNCPISVYRNSKSIDGGTEKLKDNFRTWIDEEATKNVEDEFLEEKARIETVNWKKLIAKR